MNHFSFLTLVLAVSLITTAALSARAHGAAAAEPPRNLDNIQGLWVWRAQWIVDEQERADLLRFCEKWGFNLIMMQIHMDRDEQGQPTLRHPDELAALIAEAAERGIAVEALDGAKDMAMAANRPETMAKLDAILAFNASLPKGRRLVGIHYDIEPYIMDEWKASQEQRNVIMHDLLSFFAEARAKLEAEAPDMLLAADIPMWYDNKTEPGDSCIIEFNGETKNLHKHIQDLCDYIGIMSYRQHAVGPNSVVYHVMNELEYAESIGKQVLPALETVQLSDTPQITFHGQSAETFWTQHNLVRETLGNRPGFGGMLTHSYRGLRDLLKPNSTSTE